MRLITTIAPLFLAVFLFAPALKARFLFSDVYLYLIPLSGFVFLTAIANLIQPHKLFNRAFDALWLLLPFAPTYLAWFNESENFSLLLTVAINCSLGMMVIIYPWDRAAFDRFMLFCTLLGATLATNSLLYYSTFEALQNASEYVKKSYLSVAIASGIGCLASLYILVKRLSIIHLGFLVLNWTGLALSRGRGAVLICAVVTILYFIVLFLSQVATLTFRKKLLIFLFIASLSPFIISKLLVLNSGKWTRLLFDFDAEVDEGLRGYVMKQAMNQIMEKPFFGNGLGQYLSKDTLPHNLFLQYGVDAGFFGILVLLIFFCLISYKCIDSMRQSDHVDLNLTLAVATLFVYTIANYMKSGDAYLGRDWFILSSLPIAVALLISARPDIPISRE